MAISVTCICGTVYNLKEEFAGQRVRCPKCAAEITVPGAGVSVPASGQDPLFGLHTYHMNQKLFRVSEQYTVFDESGRALLFIKRPAQMIRRFLALFLAVPLSLVAGIYSGIFISSLNIVPLLGLLGFPIGIAVFVTVLVLVEAKRHIYFYADEKHERPVMRIHQNEKLTLLKATYDVLLPDDTVLGYLIKPQWGDVFRKIWRLERSDRTVWATAHEDSVILALLRRLIGPLFGLLRTNFVIFRPGTENKLGEFNRKMTIRDRYVLDMSADRGFELDRRMALALAVMLDTGERR